MPSKIHNKVKKLRGKHYIEVDAQIIRWRQNNAKRTLQAPVDTPPDAQKCPINDEQPAAKGTLAWNIFEEV